MARVEEGGWGFVDRRKALGDFGGGRGVLKSSTVGSRLHRIILVGCVKRNHIIFFPLSSFVASTFVPQLLAELCKTKITFFIFYFLFLYRV